MLMPRRAAAWVRFPLHFSRTAKMCLFSMVSSESASAVSGEDGEAALNRLAREVANRGKDPYAAVRELLALADGARKSA